jgi:hypothetical protein
MFVSGFGFLRQAKIALSRGVTTPRRGKTHPGGSKEADWMYRLRDPQLNELATDPISLLEYNAFILESGKESDDTSPTETAATESESDEPPDLGQRITVRN